MSKVFSLSYSKANQRQSSCPYLNSPRINNTTIITTSILLLPTPLAQFNRVNHFNKVPIAESSNQTHTLFKAVLFPVSGSSCCPVCTFPISTFSIGILTIVTVCLSHCIFQMIHGTILFYHWTYYYTGQLAYIVFFIKATFFSVSFSDQV